MPALRVQIPQVNLLRTDMRSVDQNCLGWATLPVRIFTTGHLRVLRGDVTEPEVIKLMEHLLEVRDKVIPQFYLRSGRVLSIRQADRQTTSLWSQQRLVVLASAVQLCILFTKIEALFCVCVEMYDGLGLKSDKE